MLVQGKRDPSIIATDHNDGDTLTIFVRNCRTKLTYRKRSIMIEHKCFSRLLWFSMSVTLSVSFWILLLLYSLSYPGEGHLSHTGLWLIPCICRTCGLQMAGREPSFFLFNTLQWPACRHYAYLVSGYQSSEWHGSKRYFRIIANKSLLWYCISQGLIHSHHIGCGPRKHTFAET